MPETLSTRARAHLRGLAHHLEPTVLVGQDGITDAVCRAASIALEDHELIKVKLTSGFVGDRKEAAGQLAERTGAVLAQLIGRVVVLYRRRAREVPKKKRIKLP